MGQRPTVSIVMGVYNGAGTLRATVDSILGQTFAAWEFIVVDDASTDETPQILEEFANKDSRIRVLRQPINGGLTRALIRGCNVAEGTYIARQDVGDISFNTRLEKQLEFLEEHPTVVAVGCGIRRVGPQGEFLGEASRTMSPEEVTRVFLESGKAIVHPASMFRRLAYQTTGGYRHQFRVAQDIDLWYRLGQLGLIAELPDVLLVLAIDLRGISATSREKQQQLAMIAKTCFEARKSNLPEVKFLEQAETTSNATGRQTSGSRDERRKLAEPSYFIGSELFGQRNASCRPYLAYSIRSGFRLPHAVAKFMLSFFICTSVDKN